MRSDVRYAGEAGFALLAALLVLAVLSLTAAAGLLLASAEAGVAAAYRASLEADLAAQAGLEQLLAESVGPPAPDRTFAVPGGPARVETERVALTPDGRPIYRIRSRAPWTSGGGGALREVERLAVLLPPVGRPPAALAATGAVAGGGPAARLSGFDAAADCPAPPGDAAGASVPAGGAAGLTAGTVEGTPPVFESPTPTAPAVADGPSLMARLAGLDGRAAGLRIVQDGATLAAGASGTGLLAAVGDLQLGEGFAWEGLVVTAGALTVDGGPTVRGAVLAGLGATSGTPSAAPTVELGEGSPEIAYDLCAVADAVLAASRLGRVPGSWKEAF